MVRMSVGDSLRPMILPGRESRAPSPRGVRPGNHKNHDKMAHVATADEFYARSQANVIKQDVFNSNFFSS